MENKVENKDLEHLSSSKFNLLEDCFGKYFFKYVKQISLPEFIFFETINGLTIHAIFEDILKIIKTEKTNIKKINSFIENEFENKFKTILVKETEENKKKLIAKNNFNKKQIIPLGIKWTKNFFLFFYNYILKYSKEFFSEKRFEIEFKNYLITGFIDFLAFDTNENIYIIDFKTTSDIKKWFFIDFASDTQSLFYSFAVNKLYDKTPKRFSYVILSQEKKMIFANSNSETRNKEEIEKQFIELVERFDENKNKVEDFELWKPSEKKCSFCSYSKVCSKSVSKKK